MRRRRDRVCAFTCNEGRGEREQARGLRRTRPYPIVLPRAYFSSSVSFSTACYHAAVAAVIWSTIVLNSRLR